MKSLLRGQLLCLLLAASSSLFARSLANDEQWPYRLQFIGTSRKN